MKLVMKIVCLLCVSIVLFGCSNQTLEVGKCYRYESDDPFMSVKHIKIISKSKGYIQYQYYFNGSNLCITSSRDERWFPIYLDESCDNWRENCMEMKND